MTLQIQSIKSMSLSYTLVNCSVREGVETHPAHNLLTGEQGVTYTVTMYAGATIASKDEFPEAYRQSSQ